MKAVINDENTVIVTSRNVEIIQDYSNGISVADIAVKHSLTKRTVETVMLKLKKQFSCKNLAQLTATFIRKDLMK